MSSNVINSLKNATYCILYPTELAKFKGFPVPRGTGFFVSPSGHFITALHVITDQNGKLLNPDLFELQKLDRLPPQTIKNLKLVTKWDNLDLALMKADFSKIKGKHGWEDKNCFEYLSIDFNSVPEGTEVYSFGYPLPEMPTVIEDNIQTIGWNNICPRLTSAIISSHYKTIGCYMTDGAPEHYVIDKALNYGNSGGPIVIKETGKVISVCLSFQPVAIKQNPDLSIYIPSLYGLTRSLKTIETELKQVLSACDHEYSVIEERENLIISDCKKVRS